jgi:hypothetical protein
VRATRGFSFAFCLSTVALAAAAKAGPHRAAPPVARRTLARASRSGLAEDEPARARIAITLAGEPDCAPALRAVLAAQLSDVAAAVTWSCQARFEADEPFRELAGAGVDVRVWIDLSPAREARVTLHDEHENRFFLRRLPLPAGVGEIEREEIGEVVRSGTIAVSTGAAGALSRAEARVAVSRWPAPTPPHAPPARAAPVVTPPPTFELGPSWTAHALARGLPFVQEVALAAALSPRSARVSFWSEAGYRLPASYQGTSVGVRLTALALRAGVTWWTSRDRLRLGLGAGVDVERVWFVPQGAGASVEPTAPDHFDTLAGRVLVALQLRASGRLVLRLDLLCDIATADVHYDVKGGSGMVQRALTQWPVQPGIGLAVTWRSGV